MLKNGSAIYRTKEAVRAVIGPRLGRFHQHDPRPLRQIPDYGPLNLDALQQLPSIGIVTPSFQQGHFIAATIRSVVAQRYPRLQYFVQDGGSTDSTLSVLKAIEADLTGWTSAPDGGQTSAINTGFRNLDSEIMAYLNSDDLLLPGALTAVGDFFRRNPEIDVVYGDRLIIDDDGNEVGAWRLPRHNDTVLSWADYLPQETLFWRRRAWERAGARMDEAFGFAMDWDLILRLRDTGARFVHLPRFLGAFRVHSEQKTSMLMATAGQSEMMTLRERALGFRPGRLQLRMAVLPYLLAHIGVDLAGRAGDALRASRGRGAR